MSTKRLILEQRRQAVEEAEAALRRAKRLLSEAESPELGKLPNKRAGFYHAHSASYECGIAYRDEEMDGIYVPCRKLVNHEGRCGYENNTAF